jgi:hypothetical protein
LGAPLNAAVFFKWCFYYYYIPTTCFGPFGPSSGRILVYVLVGAETCSGYVIAIKKIRKTLLRLMAPPKIVIIEATGCNPEK